MISDSITRLAAGEIVAYPTETFYALGCDPSDPPAVARLNELKARPELAGLPLIVSSSEWVERHNAAESLELRRLRMKLQENFWPGPLTIVFSANESARKQLCPEIFGPDYSLAVRVSPSEPAAQAALAAGGAIISTSANPRGLPPPKTAAEVRGYFPNYRILGGQCGGALKPSTIVDVRSPDLKILRDGEIPADLIQLLFKSIF